MKKIISLFLCLALLAGTLCGCSVTLPWQKERRSMVMTVSGADIGSDLYAYVLTQILRTPAKYGLESPTRETAEEKAVQPKIHELSRGGDGGGVPPQSKPVDIPCQRDIFLKDKNCFLHGAAHWASMVEILLVISSSTSSTMRTVSREVKRVTAFSTAHWRMAAPSALWLAEWMVRVLMM